MTQLSTNPSFAPDIAFPILNPADENSLVSIVIRYTLTRDGERPRRWPVQAEKNPELTGLFSSNFAEYQDQLKIFLKDKAADECAVVLRSASTVFRTELENFEGFCKKTEKTAEGEGKIKDSHPRNLADFVTYFVTIVLKSETAAAVELRTLLVACYDKLITKQYTMPYKNPSHEPAKEICTPLAALVLQNIIGSVLGALRHGHYSLIRLAIRKKVFEMHKGHIATYGKTSSKEDRELIEDMAEPLFHRVEFNLQSLERILQRCVHKKMYTTQYPQSEDDLESFKEAEECKKGASYLQDCANMALLDMLKTPKAEPGQYYRVREYGEDYTEMELDADLYTSHFSLHQTFVRMSTVEMLELTNLIWRAYKGDLGGQDDISFRLGGDKDYMLHVLDKILPRVAQDGEDGRPRSLFQDTRPAGWQMAGEIWLEQQHGEGHNLRLRTRFMEFMEDPKHEPTFCQITKAPVPRSLCCEEQQKQSGLELVKEYSIPEEERGQMVKILDKEPVYAFQALQDIIEEASGSKKERAAVRYKIIGTNSMTELRNAFNSIAKAVQQDIKEGHADSKMRLLCKHLEEGVEILTKINTDASFGKSVLQYIDRDIQRRQNHCQYLKDAHYYMDRILQVRNKYNEQLKETVEFYFRVAEVSKSCETHDIFLTAAQQRSVKIAFARVRRIKQKIRKSNPTKGQNVLESLSAAAGRNSSQISFKLEDLKETIRPKKTWSYAALVKKGVLSRVNDNTKTGGHTHKEQKQLQFTFQMLDESCVIHSFLAGKFKKEMIITREQIAKLQGCNKTILLSYGDDYIWMNGARLRRQIALLEAQTGV